MLLAELAEEMVEALRYELSEMEGGLLPTWAVLLSVRAIVGLEGCCRWERRGFSGSAARSARVFRFAAGS
ncbi:hypothetical protein ES702_02655 [subsurface metagenome]